MSLSGVGFDGAFVTRTATYKPHDSACGIDNDLLAALVDDGTFDVGEIVANEFAALHAKGGETVAFPYGAQCQWKCHLSVVKSGAIRRLGYHKVICYYL